MNKLQKNQTGFGVVGIVLILLLAAFIALVGFYVFKSKDDSAASSDQSSSEPAPVADPTADWTVYTSVAGGFTLKHPPTWVTAVRPELCSENIVLLGANSDAVGTCGSENFGQVAIVWRTDTTTCEDPSPELWNQTSKESVTVDGVAGTKSTATALASEFDIGSLPEGTKRVEYCFATNNKVYTAFYTQQATYPDSLDDFNTMITETLQFD